ncbi:hypothetical protein [Rhodanobacter sp. DHB23]|uniref:hypothetical protein n=1 Tax=Rhodanobacter sp. DHB23 TaxID=2775923 RepID=UPI00177EF3CB|nr:hypothetical protein [Rhodanobacter sp. DHB23]MBD8873857.1 hypothetical protein [Rhodanobacter sp. DHB23]
MATESAIQRTNYMLPLDLVDEADKLAYQANAVLECLVDARAVLDSPEVVLDGIGWLLRDQIARLKEICNTVVEARA